MDKTDNSVLISWVGVTLLLCEQSQPFVVLFGDFANVSHHVKVSVSVQTNELLKDCAPSAAFTGKQVGTTWPVIIYCCITLFSSLLRSIICDDIIN